MYRVRLYGRSRRRVSHYFLEYGVCAYSYIGAAGPRARGARSARLQARWRVRGGPGVAGGAVELTAGWDFEGQDHRLQGERRLGQQEPFVLIGSPPCPASRQLQSLSSASENTEQMALREGIEPMRFVVRPYEKQVRAGRVLVHENLSQAKSWSLPDLRNMMRDMV